MKFSEKVTKLRKRYGYTQETFASEVGVSRQSVYKWENGTSYPELEKLLKIARTLFITVDDLLNEEMGLNEDGVAVPMTDEEASLVKVKRLKVPTRAPRKVAEEAPAVEETPVEETPVEEAPTVEEAPVEEAPAEEAVTEQTPLEEKKKRGGLFGWFRRK